MTPALPCALPPLNPAPAQAALGDLLRRGSGPVAQQQQPLGEQVREVKEEEGEEEDLTEEPEAEGEEQRTGARTPPLSPQPTGSTGRRVLPSAVHGGAELYDTQYGMPYDMEYDISPGGLVRVLVWYGKGVVPKSSMWQGGRGPYQKTMEVWLDCGGCTC